MVNEEKYSKLLCMLSLSYQILDNSRANDILWQKKGKKEREKFNPNSIEAVLIFLFCFVKIILRNEGTKSDFYLPMDVSLV